MCTCMIVPYHIHYREKVQNMLFVYVAYLIQQQHVIFSIFYMIVMSQMVKKEYVFHLDPMVVLQARHLWNYCQRKM